MDLWEHLYPVINQLTASKLEVSVSLAFCMHTGLTMLPQCAELIMTVLS